MVRVHHICCYVVLLDGWTDLNLVMVITNTDNSTDTVKLIQFSRFKSSNVEKF